MQGTVNLWAVAPPPSAQRQPIGPAVRQPIKLFKLCSFKTDVALWDYKGQLNDVLSTHTSCLSALLTTASNVVLLQRCRQMLGILQEEIFAALDAFVT